VNGPLRHLKVLEIGHYVAAPYCAKLLADLGADVVKVERPDAGDPARRLGPFAPSGGLEGSALFLHLNTSKRGITLNLKSTTGRDLLLRLVADADLVIENFRPGVVARLGLDHQSLVAINPKVSLLSISSFGQTGPYRDRRATEITEFAASGVMFSTGAADREPLRYPGYQAQLHAGIVAASGGLAVAMQARLTGRGQWIDLSILEATAYLMEPWLMFPSFSQRNGVARRGAGNEFWPRAIYPCQDGYVYATIPDRRWPALARMIGRPDLAEDPEYATLAGRLAHQDEVELALVPWLLAHSKDEIFRQAQQSGLDWGALFTTAELLDNEHFQARDFWAGIDHPVVGRLDYPGPHYRLSASPWALRRPAPLLGQHNAEVLGQFGLGADDLAILRERGVI
jgi:crotonobetainyl-CoA:carnitine CoA-transferase CaiB-like acyl-CoA transferase